MANEINKINSANSSYQLGKIRENQQDKTTKQEESKPQVDKKEVPADDVLKFMNAQSVTARPVEKPRVLNISKYVTPEQAQRICGFITQFEDAVAEGLIKIEKELGNALSSEAKIDLAVELFKAENM